MSFLNKSGLKSWAQRPKPKEVWSENASFYNAPAWRNCRKAYMDAHPLCEVSLFIGKHVAGKDCDHIIPVRFGGSPYDPRNLMSLTGYFHRKKSAMERNRNTVLVSYMQTPDGLIPKNRDEIFQVLI